MRAGRIGERPACIAAYLTCVLLAAQQGLGLPYLVHAMQDVMKGAQPSGYEGLRLRLPSSVNRLMSSVISSGAARQPS